MKETSYSSKTERQAQGAATGPSWTYLSNHGHVLVCLARDPTIRLRDVATAVGITERGVHRIVRELEESGVIEITRTGRRNHYKVFRDTPLRHPLEDHHTVGELLDATVSELASRGDS